MNTVLAAAVTAAPHLNTTQLGVSVIASIIVLILLVTVAKLHPFVSLILAGLVVGIGSGYGPVNTITSFSTSFGSTMASVGILIGLGAMLGRVLMDTGAADSIVDTLVSRSSKAMIPWTMAVIGALIGLPMFFEVGLVMLVPVIVLVTRRTGLPLMKVAIPTLAGLSVMHACVPPHPGPLAALSCFKDNPSVGITMLFGIPIAILTVVIVGPAFAAISAKWVPVGAPANFAESKEDRGADGRALPSFGLSVLCILLPAVLMLINAICEIAAPKAYASQVMWTQIVSFLGKPELALLIAVLFSMIALGSVGHIPFKKINESLGAALPPVAGILLIVGGGGGYKGVLVDTGIGTMIGGFVEHSHISILLLGWLIAVFVRVATGSATVSIMTTAGILGPVMDTMGASPAAVSLLVLAIGAGSIFLSHVNDAGFWLVKEYFNLDVGQTFKTWSVLECLLSVVVLALVLVASIFVPIGI
ncbi:MULTISPECIES: GntP family permease [Bifidobacterium]|jgi:GntP family gluconate:H+ symporter|uniref:Gluconate transporter n=1 Tax=Bifidobacterium tibiigranuli TaxID=2172043 RepID=A0A5N6RX62_9BIFI|nr:gluconate:H+ symporter [Bifidobacterium tibiigranuli]KAE8127018.1 gluconate transporter [Bifidobacterium tibiigranuli]KAE8127784.1 gluconate transporter [Bifidobacterium tibiigranuli]MCI1211492.1 GntP family permease [Bifidobacterium tibiigranuli]MCI1221685.1 GntP family permease [Bifidobacterium tibiigranuli]MCI1232937.1 GntP family permease [Bifidobacterium tibiigranuli]